MDKKQLYESIMRQVSREVKKALNENFDNDDLQYAEDVDGNPDLMLGHMLKKAENSDEARFEYVTKQLEKIQELVNSGEKLLSVTYRPKGKSKTEWQIELYNYIECHIEDEYCCDFNIDVNIPMSKNYEFSYMELYTNYCGPVGNMNIDRLLNGETLVMAEDEGEYMCIVKMVDKN